MILLYLPVTLCCDVYFCLSCVTGEVCSFREFQGVSFREKLAIFNSGRKFLNLGTCKRKLSLS